MEVLISAADVIDDFVFILDERANIIFANKYAQKKLGYTLEEISKMNVLEVHPEPLRGEALSIVQDMLAGKSKFCPLPLVTKNNKHIPVETRVKYITIDGKQYLFGISKDMTEQYKANEKFIKAFDSNPSPMAISKIETGEYINVNRAFINTLGYSKHEIIGRKSTELKILQNSEREMLLKLIKKKGSLKDEAVDIIIKNGEIRNGLFSADIIEIDGEEYLLSILFDITEKITKEKKLKENEKKLQTIFDNFNTGISVTDEEGNIIDCNKASEEILGVTKEEHLTRNYAGKEWKILREDLSIMPSDEFPSVKALKEGRVVKDVVMGVEKSDSTISWISVSAVPMELEGYGVMISYVEITARKEIEKELILGFRMSILFFSNINESK